MNVLGLGTDLVEIERIESLIARHGDRFLARVFTEDERTYCGSLREPARCYAARFAAKEAASKALGSGIGPEVGWLDLNIVRNGAGKPSLQLTGAAKAFAQSLGIAEILISLSHSEHYAVAQALAVGP